MPILNLSVLHCQNPEDRSSGRDRLQIQISSGDTVIFETEVFDLASGESLDLDINQEFTNDVTVNLVQVNQRHSLGRSRLNIDDTQQALRFCWHNTDYSLNVIVRADPDPDSEEASETEAPAILSELSPEEPNVVRETAPNVLIFHPIYNEKIKTEEPHHPPIPEHRPPYDTPYTRWCTCDGDPVPLKGDAIEFKGEMIKFAETIAALDLKPMKFQIDNGYGKHYRNDGASQANKNRIAQGVIDAITQFSTHYPHLPEELKVKAVVLCCHGWTKGMSLGLSRERGHDGKTLAIIDLIAQVACRDVKVILYACATGSPFGANAGNTVLPWIAATDYSGAHRQVPTELSPGQPPTANGQIVLGQSGFADWMRTQLVSRGLIDCSVFAHVIVAHCCRYPWVLRFDGNGGHPSPGGQWVIAPPVSRNLAGHFNGHPQPEHRPQGGDVEVVIWEHEDFSGWQVAQPPEDAAVWRRWQFAMQNGHFANPPNTLRFRYPFMSKAEIVAELRGAG